MRRRVSAFPAALLLTLLLPLTKVHGQEPHVHRPAAAIAGLGAVAFANSGGASAQAPFQRGLALLHSFEYDEAAEAFRAAQAADPAFAMAFWGEALTFSHLLWGEDDPEGARAALKRLAATREARLAKAGTGRERVFGEAIEALFVDGDVPTRVRGFADGIRRVVSAHPDDPDAAAFAALASMFSQYAGRLAPAERDAARDAAIEFAQRVFTANPDHPGGAHYLIHACDDPALAARGLEAARHYALIAPDSEHALHMPSHIFVQLGVWRDTVASNERSWAASQKEVVARKLTNADLSFHALLYLQYGQLQLGQYQASRAAIARAKQMLAGVDLTTAQHVDARFAVRELAFQHATNADDWSEAVCRDIGPEPAVPAPGAGDRERAFAIRASYQWTVAAVRCDRPAATIEALRTRLAALPADDPSRPMRQMALRHAELLAYIDKGVTGDLDALLADPTVPSQAAIGPPPTLRTEELLGQARLKAGRPREAVVAYERALQLTPNRSPALLGLARARFAAGDAAGAADAYRRLLENWREADAGLPILAEARARAGTR